jgi:Na+/H+ antiporter NhaC
MLNKFFNNKIKSSLFLALIVYVFLNILVYFHLEQKKNDIEKFDETKSEILKSNKNSDKQLEIKKQIQNYGIKASIVLIPISLLIGFSQFFVFKNMTKRFYKISDAQTERKKL